jgi:hypothetical protein
MATKKEIKTQWAQFEKLKAQLKFEIISKIELNATRSWILRDLHRSWQDNTSFLVETEQELSNLEANRKMIRTILKSRDECVDPHRALVQSLKQTL